MSLAIFDDIGAIIIIALFYTDGLSTSALIIAAVSIATLFVLNRRGMHLAGALCLRRHHICGSRC